MPKYIMLILLSHFNLIVLCFCISSLNHMKQNSVVNQTQSQQENSEQFVIFIFIHIVPRFYLAVMTQIHPALKVQ